MGPHDLLCKWCSTFVGKGKKFCSIFCESRHTRSKRRHLPFKRPVYSSGPTGEREFESPRSNKTAPGRRETFLEDVITAVGNEKPSPERDKRPDGNASGVAGQLGNAPDSHRKEYNPTVIVPKLDLSSSKDKKAEQEKHKGGAKILDDKSNVGKKQNKSDTILGATVDSNLVTKEKSKEIHEQGKLKSRQVKETSDLKAKDKIDRAIKSKTQTLIVHKNSTGGIGSKIPIASKSLLNQSVDEVMTKSGSAKKRPELDSTGKSEMKNRKLTNLNDRIKLDTNKAVSDLGIVGEAKERQMSKSVSEYKDRVRSSGYGNPTNPRLRPMVLKPRSATLTTSSTAKQNRDTSAPSAKSTTMDKALAVVKQEDNRPIATGRNQSKWELIPSTINEEISKSVSITNNGNANTSLEDEDPTPKTSPRRNDGSNRSELTKINEIVREESTNSEILDQGELQSRLTSIKRKVETVRKRRQESRSSMGSDLDTSFQGSTTDLATDRDLLNNSFGTMKSSRSTKVSARSNITKISNQFQTKAA